MGPLENRDPSRGTAGAKALCPHAWWAETPLGSALVCLILSFLICQKEEAIPLLPLPRDITR